MKWYNLSTIVILKTKLLRLSQWQKLFPSKAWLLVIQKCLKNSIEISCNSLPWPSLISIPILCCRETTLKLKIKILKPIDSREEHEYDLCLNVKYNFYGNKLECSGSAGFHFSFFFKLKLNRIKTEKSKNQN